jgi:FkbM family methyltransferase
VDAQSLAWHQPSLVVELCQSIDEQIMSNIKFIEKIDNYESRFRGFVHDLLQFMYSEVYTSNQDHVMVDVGANSGAITAIMLEHVNFESGQIVAIDAHPNWLNNFALASHSLVQTHNVGCYSRACTKKFVDQAEMTGMGFIGLSPTKDSLQVSQLTVTSVECVTLDSMIPADQTVSFIKIDAESSDFEVLLGSERILTNNRPFVVFEFSGQIFEKAHGHTREDFFNFFERHQYQLYSVVQGRPQDFIRTHWDSFAPELRDILAIPGEYQRFVTKL